MNPCVLWNHTLVLASVIAGIAGMGMVFDAASHGNLHELSFGIPALFIGLWWAGRELGRSILAGRARSAARRSNPTHNDSNSKHAINPPGRRAAARR